MSSKPEERLELLQGPIEFHLRGRLQGVLKQIRSELPADLAINMTAETAEAPQWRQNHPRMHLRYSAEWNTRPDDGLPDQPTLAGEALDNLELKEVADDLVVTTAKSIVAGFNGLKKLDRAVKDSVFARVRSRWPFLGVGESAAWLNLLMAWCEATPKGELLYGEWPDHAPPDAVAKWAKKHIVQPLEKRKRSDDSDVTFNEQLGTAYSGSRDGHWSRQFLMRKSIVWVPVGVGLLYEAHQAVEEDRRRPAFALDTHSASYQVVSALKGNAQYLESLETDDNGRVELLEPGRKPIQLYLDREHFGPSLNEQVMRAIKKARGGAALRDWAVFLNLLHNKGGRSGEVMWSLDDHLEAKGYNDRHRRDPKVRKAASEMMWFFTQLKLRVYGRNKNEGTNYNLITHLGVERVRRATSTHKQGGLYNDVEVASPDWEVVEQLLKINPYLYQGVRPWAGGKRGLRADWKASKQLGTSFWWVPKELIQLNERYYSAALCLGLDLAFKLRWDVKDDIVNDVVLSGRSTLEAADLSIRGHSPTESWEVLERQLDKLVKIELLDSWRWRDGARTLNGCLVVSAGEWQVDRVARGIRPEELPFHQAPSTGGELAIWLKDRGLTQTKGAQILGVHQSTLSLAIKSPDKTLGKGLKTALERAPKIAE